MGVADYLWFAGLSHDDQQRLRASVRRVQMKHYPARHINDRECDKIIAALGPETAERQIEAMVNSGALDAKIFSVPPKLH